MRPIRYLPLIALFAFGSPIPIAAPSLRSP